MNAKTLKATIDFVQDCRNNKDYPYYYDDRDMHTIISFLVLKMQEQDCRNENKKHGLKGVL